MSARVPQDVDLEDKLVFGLPPLRFAYVVVAVALAAACWRCSGWPLPLRAGPAAVCAAAGAVLAWGRWRSRPVDAWLLDAAGFLRRNYPPRLLVRLSRARRRAWLHSRKAPPVPAGTAAGGRVRAPWVVRAGGSQ